LYRIRYLLFYVASITHYSIYLYLDFKRVNVNNNKRAALQQRVSALFATALRYKAFCLYTLFLYHTPTAATTTIAIDLFIFYTLLGVLLCKLYSYAILPTTLATYISKYYLSNACDATTSSLPSSKLRKLAKLLADYLCKRF
jgi:hypothetical protein